MNPDPIVLSGLVAGAGFVAVWGARTLLEVRDGVRDVKTTLHGVPESKEPNGLVREVKSQGERLRSVEQSQHDMRTEWDGLRQDVRGAFDAIVEYRKELVSPRKRARGGPSD